MCWCILSAFSHCCHGSVYQGEFGPEARDCIKRTGLIGVDIYTLLYVKEITNKDLLYSTGNSTQ